MKARTHSSGWRSATAEQKFHDAEQRLVRERYAEAPQARDVPSHLGRTRVYCWNGTGDPVVFLHGATGTGLSWAPYAVHREGRTVYAVDTIGDVGSSHQDVAVSGPDDLARWLSEALGGLGLDRAHLVGTSYGGYLALLLATREPDRVRSLYLIEPAGLAPVQIGRFMRWGTASLMAGQLPAALRAKAARRLRNPLAEDRELMRLGLYAGRHHRSGLLRPVPFTDDELHEVVAPAHFVIAQHSEAWDSGQVRARAALVRHATIDVVGDGGHALAVSHVDRLAPDIFRYTAGDAADASPVDKLQD